MEKSGLGAIYDRVRVERDGRNDVGKLQALESRQLLEPDFHAIGARIRYLRISMGLTQAELAGCLQISTSFMGHIERGTRIMSVQTLSRVSQLLDISLDALFYGYDTTNDSHGQDGLMPKDLMLLKNMTRVLHEHRNEWMEM